MQSWIIYTYKTFPKAFQLCRSYTLLLGISLYKDPAERLCLPKAVRNLTKQNKSNQKQTPQSWAKFSQVNRSPLDSDQSLEQHKPLCSWDHWPLDRSNRSLDMLPWTPSLALAHSRDGKVLCSFLPKAWKMSANTEDVAAWVAWACHYKRQAWTNGPVRDLCSPGRFSYRDRLYIYLCWL